MNWRAVSIWAFGLIGGACLGGVIGTAFSRPFNDVAAVGAIGGICVFACLRVWLGDPRPKRDLPIFDLTKSPPS